MNYIAFPSAGIEFNINPVAFTLMGKNIYWYGIIITTGIIVAILYCSLMAKNQNIDYNNILDIVLYGIPASIIFARLYYVIFSWDKYKNNLSDIFAIWEGGIAIYGAIIGAVITAYVYCKAKKLNILKIFDICIMGVIIGQIIGRWGNFVNVEAFGSETSLPWRMSVYVNGKLSDVHPTFLYESLWNLLGFIILSIFLKRKIFDGQIFFSYLIWYGIGRFFIEGLRTDSLYFFNFRVSQIVALLSVFAGIICIIFKSEKLNKNNKKSPE